MAAIYRLGDLVQIVYPYADLSGEKERPAVVVSSEDFCRKSGMIVAAPVTGSTWIEASIYGTIEILDLTKTDLTKPSCIKSMLLTVTVDKVLRKRGEIDKSTRANLVKQVKAFFPS